MRRPFTDGVILQSSWQYAMTPEEELEQAIRWYSNPISEASAHYLVAHDGSVINLVDPKHIAWHAGSTLNARWIGITLAQSNPGGPIYAEQYASLAGLIKQLSADWGFTPGQETVLELRETPQAMKTGLFGIGQPFDKDHLLELIHGSQR
jgi:hypothetical protein